MALKAAFNILLQVHGRNMTLSRPGGSSVSVRLAPSNYFRNMEAPEQVVVKGREFVMSKESLDLSGFGLLKRGDRLTDSDLGTNTISEVREMFDFGGAVIGYRIRTQ